MTPLGITISAIVLCTNTNWQHSERCLQPVDYFIVEENGEAFGFLTNGIQFTQTNVVNNVTRLQRFNMEEVEYFISDKGVIYADDELEALSIYLSL